MTEDFICLQCANERALVKPTCYTVKGGKCPVCNQEPRVLADVDGWSVVEKVAAEE
jgi:hypothetical protein